jgi:hypothetical protein
VVIAGAFAVTGKAASIESIFTMSGIAGTNCHCEARRGEAIPCVTSVPRLVTQGIASSLRASQ